MKDAEKGRKVEVESRKEKEKGRQEHEKGNHCGNLNYNYFLECNGIPYFLAF
jgi:hypothetical protein